MVYQVHVVFLAHTTMAFTCKSLEKKFKAVLCMRASQLTSIAVHVTIQGLTWAKNLPYFEHDVGQGFTTQQILTTKTIQRYPRDTIVNIFPDIKDTPKVKDQDVWQRQRPLARARQTARPI